ncbi:hypothetical protein ABW45_08180 [Stenotrophomonas maltophilia]|nr:hypothetical protein ABW45_08180 [Stenotrophomonas maltophilia]
MVVPHDDRGGISQERLPDELTWMDLGTIDSALKELDELDQAVAGIQKGSGEHLPLQAAKLVAEVSTGYRGIPERGPTLQALVDDLACSFHDLVRGCWAITRATASHV